MLSVSDSNEHDNDIDRKQLTLLRERFMALNQERFERTLAVLSERQQHFLALLPLLFHVNHPLLPGYALGPTPKGVVGYSPTKDQVRLAKLLSRSFHYQRDLVVKSSAVDAIFLMGSLGSIAHSDKSDMDVWICHADHLSSEELILLQKKCDLLSQWAAANNHAEVHFFLMSAEQFRQGNSSAMSSEASGTAQHFLLLDEFYRTAVWLAGKWPLWWFVPVNHETEYARYSTNLLRKRFVRAQDVIDFGGIPHIPTNEFMGAGIWQLYKAIVSPYKSVLKLMLLEAYSHPDFSEPLSLSMKRKIYAGKMDADEVDAYLLIYQRLEQYLIAMQQPQRLELVRRCFYFKAGRDLTQGHRTSSKTMHLLMRLVQSWGWESSVIQALDNRLHWKAARVIEERNLLANELNQAYRLLVDMNSHALDDAAISAQELLILGRKLQAEFERKAGKIDWINPAISRDLGERDLSFVQTETDQGSLWQVYCVSQPQSSLREKSREPIKRTRHFMELFLWSYCNGILQANTRVDIVSKSFSLTTAPPHQLMDVLQAWAPLPVKKPNHEAFMASSFPARILMLINVGVQPQAELQKKGLHMLSSQRDALGYSGFKENLVRSIDIIQWNSWGELICWHFDVDALLNAMLHYLRVVPRSSAILPEWTIRCFSAGQGVLIEQRVAALWRAMTEHIYADRALPSARFIFEMAEEYVVLQWAQEQAEIRRFAHYEKLLEYLSEPQCTWSPIAIDSFALRDKPLRWYCDAAKQPGVYIFYRVDSHAIHVTVIDKNGAIFSTRLNLYQVQTLLRPLCHFIRRSMMRLALNDNPNGDKQALASDLHKLHIAELVGDLKQKNIHLEARKIAQDLTSLRFTNICAVLEPDGKGYWTLTLVCDAKEFSELDWGAQLYTQVANYIVGIRQSKDRYPCYITDLDLSSCRDLIAPGGTLQLVHCLKMKWEIEDRINHALQRMFDGE